VEGAVFIVLFALVAVAAGVLARYLRERRRETLSALAISLGLEYSAEDPFESLSYPFALLSKGDGRGVENVMWGMWGTLPLRAFDYWYYQEHRDGNGNRSRSYSRFSCAVTEVNVSAAHLTIDRESALTALADHLGLRDIEFESEEFNREFNVKCGDRKFANDLVDARMMRWLLGADADLRFEVAGRWLLAFSEKRRPEELVSLFASLGGFRDHLPRIVYELYPGRVG
jgi:hypothetical protein